MTTIVAISSAAAHLDAGAQPRAAHHGHEALVRRRARGHDLVGSGGGLLGGRRGSAAGCRCRAGARPVRPRWSARDPRSGRTRPHRRCGRRCGRPGRSASRRTPPAAVPCVEESWPTDSASEVRAAARECSVALHFSGCGPRSFSSSVGQQGGVGDDVVGRRQPPRRLVDQVVSGAGFDAHLVPACTTHELGDRSCGPALGHADHQLVGDATQVREDLQTEDVQSGLTTARREERQRSWSFSQRGTHAVEHAATVTECVARSDAAMLRACQQTGARPVVEWTDGCRPGRLRGRTRARASCPPTARRRAGRTTGRS